MSQISYTYSGKMKDVAYRYAMWHKALRSGGTVSFNGKKCKVISLNPIINKVNTDIAEMDVDITVVFEEVE